mgnify:CR=1 FL=1
MKAHINELIHFCPKNDMDDIIGEVTLGLPQEIEWKIIAYDDGNNSAQTIKGINYCPSCGIKLAEMMSEVEIQGV